MSDIKQLDETTKLCNELKVIIEAWPEHIRTNVQIITPDTIGTNILKCAGMNIRGHTQSTYIDEDYTKRTGLQISKLVCYVTEQEAVQEYHNIDHKYPPTIFDISFKACIKPGNGIRQFMLPNEFWLLDVNDLTIVSRTLPNKETYKNPHKLIAALLSYDDTQKPKYTTW